MCWFNVNVEVVLNSWKNQIRDTEPASVLEAVKTQFQNTGGTTAVTKPTPCMYLQNDLWGSSGQASDQTPTILRKTVSVSNDVSGSRTWL